jgi:hypothetical protein
MDASQATIKNIFSIYYFRLSQIGTDASMTAIILRYFQSISVIYTVLQSEIDASVTTINNIFSVNIACV